MKFLEQNVVDQLMKRGHDISGFNLMVDGGVPIGSGMSSSAALECATIFALNELFHLRLSRLSMTLLAQAAEHEFAGVKCGVMDQYSSLYGKKGFAMKLDCRKIAYEYVAMNLCGWKIVLLDTNVKHSLASSAYNQRREECLYGLAQIQKYEPQVQHLRDATLPMVWHRITDETIRKRCSYVVKENARLQAACEDLRIGDIENFGKKMFATHYGLQNEYQVSCSELDWLVDAVRIQKDVAGARMMGGGFGGCTINLIRENAVDKIIDELATGYERSMGKKLSAYIVETADGTQLIKVNQMA